MNADSLMSLYISELKDLYSAERQLTKALPKMAKAASSRELSAAFRKHLEETEDHARRLEEIFDDLGEKPGGEKCEAMEGLIAEGNEAAKAKGEDSVRDAGLIVAAQKVEHYEIAGYGSVCTFAKLLGRRDDLKLLKEIIGQEKTTDTNLTELAERLINVQAAAA